MFGGVVKETGGFNLLVDKPPFSSELGTYKRDSSELGTYKRVLE